ncbi:MAG: response regulator [Dehalococcoidales bacterium]|nr:response regulator [Dehalococcoidales bacterium]
MKKILIVDDAAFMRMRCNRLLTEKGYNVVEAANGLEALQKFKQVHPDAVLLDITMPEMDGIETLKKLKELDSNICVAMVTAMGQQSMVIEALKLGAKDFVVKPFDADRVLAAVQRIVGN